MLYYITSNNYILLYINQIKYALKCSKIEQFLSKVWLSFGNCYHFNNIRTKQKLNHEARQWSLCYNINDMKSCSCLFEFYQAKCHLLTTIAKY